MGLWKFDYTIESTFSGSVEVEGDDEFDALANFDAMREDLIIDHADEVRRIGNMRILDDVYWKEVES